MAITSSVSNNGMEQIISVEGSFDYKSLEEFRCAFRNINGKPMSYIVDMSNTSFVDSSALGILLQLHFYADDNNARVGIINASTPIMDILIRTHLDELFDIQ